MVKLVALYKKPPDPEAFDAHYRDVHTPLIKKWPGLKRLDVGKVMGMPGGAEPPFYQITEMYFEDQDALRAAMRSAEGRAAGEDLQSFAPGLVTMLYVAAD
jgi:uncharacterized protein (TIGR02118 family)